MELINDVTRHADRSTELGLAIEREALETATLVLAPIVPHIAHELWQELGYTSAIIDAAWPKVDESALTRSSITIVLQVNGKVRAKIDVPADTSKEQLEHIALADEHVQRFIEGKMIRKIIVVPGKLVNVVAN